MLTLFNSCKSEENYNTIALNTLVPVPGLIFLKIVLSEKGVDFILNLLGAPSLPQKPFCLWPASLF